MPKLDSMLDIVGAQEQEIIVSGVGDFNCNFNVSKHNIAKCKQLKLIPSPSAQSAVRGY